MSHKTIKNPFFVFTEFLSPLICEQIVTELEPKDPDRDLEGNPVKMTRMNDEFETLIWERLISHVPTLEEYYGCKYKGTEKMTFSVYPENAKKPAELPGCVNSKFLRKKWVKVKDVDLTGILWLKDYHDNVPLDPSYEVYGGKLEFPAYNFSLVPQRGTLIIFPAGPHFISAISPVLVGNLVQVNINISITDKNGGIYLYQPQNFPGTWTQWFEGMF